MTDFHKYNLENWTHYYEDKIDEKTRLEMTLHLQDCSQCLEDYTYCVEGNISPAPLRVKKEIMKKVKNPLNTRQIMFAYATAACIATGFYSIGWLDKTIDYAPIGIEKSIDTIDAISENVNHITNKIIWRDLNGKEK